MIEFVIYKLLYMEEKNHLKFHYSLFHVSSDDKIYLRKYYVVNGEPVIVGEFKILSSIIEHPYRKDTDGLFELFGLNLDNQQQNEWPEVPMDSEGRRYIELRDWRWRNGRKIYEDEESYNYLLTLLTTDTEVL